MAKHLLIATDGSELADRAVAYAIDLAKTMNAKATAVTVSEIWSPVDVANQIRAGRIGAIEDFEAHAAEAANAILAKVTEKASQAGVTVATKHVADSRPADGILKAAETEKCDLIVMSSHGRRGLSELMLGSQAHEVVSRSSVPVLICK